jgi:hypothetical protein
MECDLLCPRRPRFICSLYISKQKGNSWHQLSTTRKKCFTAYAPGGEHGGQDYQENPGAECGQVEGTGDYSVQYQRLHQSAKDYRLCP